MCGVYWSRCRRDRPVFAGPSLPFCRLMRQPRHEAMLHLSGLLTWLAALPIFTYSSCKCVLLGVLCSAGATAIDLFIFPLKRKIVHLNRLIAADTFGVFLVQ